MEITIVNIIQAMLAPGIMISACGLLLLGMNNKYSLVVSRIRALDEEKRKLKTIQKESSLSSEQAIRLESIEVQTAKLVKRIFIVRNAVVSYSVAVAFFIVSSLTIGLQFTSDRINLHGLILILFLVGMLSVLIGIIHAAFEVLKGYEIVKIETAD
jgi:hypothetical protein